MATPMDVGLEGGTREERRAADPSLEALFAEFLRQSARRAPQGRLPTLRDWVDLAEAWRIAMALRQCRGNRSAAARSLGIGRRTLYSKMEKLGIAEEWGIRPPAAAPDPD